MNVPTNGITPEVIRDSMPPYHLSTDLLDAMFAATPAPPPGASIAWREERATRLIHEMAGMMPADAPQARIAAQIVIVREATDHTFALAAAPGLALEHVSRLMRTGVALSTAGVALERSLVRHQQKPVPFFGTVLAEGIDIAAIAGRWGAAGVRGDRGEGSVREVIRSTAGTDPVPQPPTASVQPATLSVQPPLPTPQLPAASVQPATPSVQAPLPSPQPPPTRGGGEGCPAQDVEAIPAVVTRLREGRGWALDVVRPRKAGDGGCGSAAIGTAKAPGA